MFINPPWDTVGKLPSYIYRIEPFVERVHWGAIPNDVKDIGSMSLTQS